jgi:DNA-binding CsgD family transcriptional regulator
MTIDAAFVATVDPATLLFTSAVADEPLVALADVFLANEIAGADVNSFASLGSGASSVATLDRATAGDRRASPRYRDILAPAGLGDELRVALRAEGRCWGVMCLHREDGAAGFDQGDVALVAAIAPHLGEGLRLGAMAESAPGNPTGDPPPGVLILDDGLGVVSANPAAVAWLTEIVGDDWNTSDDVPFPVRAAVARYRVYGDEAEATILAGGRRWVSVHLSALTGDAAPQTAVVLEAARPAQLGSLLLDAYSLTSAQRRVAALVLQGRSTQQIVNDLQISRYTLQEHLRAVFDKFGVGSRRELVAAILARR